MSRFSFAGLRHRKVAATFLIHPDKHDELAPVIRRLSIISGNHFKCEQVAIVPANNVGSFTPSPDFMHVAFVLGGDGTFATAARVFANVDAIIIGIQAGNLNFLNAFKLDNLEEIFNPNCKVSIRRTGEVEGNTFANEVVFKPATKSIGTFTIKDDRGRYLTSFRGDGLIISTATGSTAYNLSAGGPIVHPTLDVFAITPIVPIKLSSRPVIVPANKLHISADCDIISLLDGQPLGNPREEFEVSTGNFVEVLLPPNYSFFDQTREKLGWHQ